MAACVYIFALQHNSYHQFHSYIQTYMWSMWNTERHIMAARPSPSKVPSILIWQRRLGFSFRSVLIGIYIIENVVTSPKRQSINLFYCSHLYYVCSIWWSILCRVHILNLLRNWSVPTSHHLLEQRSGAAAVEVGFLKCCVAFDKRHSPLGLDNKEIPLKTLFKLVESKGELYKGFQRSEWNTNSETVHMW